MSDTRLHLGSANFPIFVPHEPSSLMGRGLVGKTKLEQAWLDAFVRRVTAELDEDQAGLLTAILWAPAPGTSRSSDDACSRLQRIGLVKPTKARSVCVPAMLTPLGHSVRECLVDMIISKSEQLPLNLAAAPVSSEDDETL